MRPNGPRRPDCSLRSTRRTQLRRHGDKNNGFEFVSCRKLIRTTKGWCLRSLLVDDAIAFRSSSMRVLTRGFICSDSWMYSLGTTHWTKTLLFSSAHCMSSISLMTSKVRPKLCTENSLPTYPHDQGAVSLQNSKSHFSGRIHGFSRPRLEGGPVRVDPLDKNAALLFSLSLIASLVWEWRDRPRRTAVGRFRVPRCRPLIHARRPTTHSRPPTSC